MNSNLHLELNGNILLWLQHDTMLAGMVLCHLKKCLQYLTNHADIDSLLHD